MKTHRRPLLLIVYLLCIAGGSLVAYGTLWITSNIVHVDMQYVVDLSYTILKKHVTLTAMVTIGGSPAGAGINVDFYFSFNAGPWTYFATETTNHNGFARARYTIVDIGEYDFQAMISVP